MAETQAKPNRLSKVLSIIVCVVGVIMLVFGIFTYTYTTQQLKNENITVAAISADNPGALAGKQVAGPFTALAQANAINHHIANATGGKTYSQMPSVATTDGVTYSRDVTQAASTDGQAHAAGDPLSAQDKAAYAARSTAQQGSFIQASLFVSVLAFGISVLVMALGVVLVFIAVALLSSFCPTKQRTKTVDSE